MPADEFGLLKNVFGVEYEPAPRAVEAQGGEAIINTEDSPDEAAGRGVSPLYQAYGDFFIEFLRDVTAAYGIPPELLREEPAGDPLREGRLRIYQIEPARMFEALNWNAISLRVVSADERPIPDDVIFVECHYDHAIRMFAITLAHSTFDRVPPHTVLPIHPVHSFSIEVISLTRVPNQRGLWQESTRTL